MKKIVIVGATSAIAMHCARIWARAPVDLALIGRDMQKLERAAADLQARSPQSRLRTIQADFLDPEAIQAVVNDAAQGQAIDIALIAHGNLPDQIPCQSDLQACRIALEINGISPALYAEAFTGHMARAGRGTLALIGSVAGDRGRGSNYVYGAAKGLLARYAQGLQHRFAGTDVKIVMIKPGPTDTPMTAQMKGQGARLAGVDDVAARIVGAVERGRPVIYAPRKWRLIMLVISHLPRFIFDKLKI